VLLSAPAVANAAAADQLAGLFIQGCLPFTGDPAALRAFAAKLGMRQLPKPAEAAFLHGAPGEAFDASGSDTKLVLVSSDDGLCSAVTDQVTQADAVAGLEAGFTKAGLRFRLVIERDDKTVPSIHDREYLVAEGKHGWRVLLATLKGDKGGEAMVTGAPE
jgi:hypothetical protein